ncbi:MAG: energy transducer TonB [Xanthomonadaceae bacterium]|nr:energy transducer TonB [Xanthomonadaceae bacterium]
MSAAAPAIGSRERFSVTFLVSLIFHGVLALGLTFAYEKPAPSLPSLDVILVQSASGQKPAHADFLAQANNTGGGDSERALRPSALVSSPVNKPDPGIAPRPLRASAPPPSPPTMRELLTAPRSDFSVRTEHETPEQTPLPQPTLHDLLQAKLEMAKLATEIQRESQAYAKRPHKKYISANTKEYAYAAYMAAWVARVERIGNLNYPDEARREHMHGQLVLTVALARSGAIKSVDVIQSSGHRILDDAAIRIVRLAAPFPPIPKDENIDELYITRTWQFLPGDILRNR